MLNSESQSQSAMGQGQAKGSQSPTIVSSAEEDPPTTTLPCPLKQDPPTTPLPCPLEQHPPYYIPTLATEAKCYKVPLYVNFCPQLFGTTP